MRQLAVELNQVSHQYSSSRVDTLPFVIPRWQVERGEHVFLHGDSGSGKSTLLNLLSGILTPQSGDIKILDHAINHMSSSKRDLYRAKHIGVVFQTFNLIPYLSIFKNVQLAAYFAKNDVHEVKSRVLELMSILHLDSKLLNVAVNELSIGQQQRVAIIRAVINSPELLLVDEPTSALDASARDAFMELLSKVASASQMAMIFVSHDQSLETYFKTKTDIRSLFVKEGEV